MTDNRTNEPKQTKTKSSQDFVFSEARVEAAAKIIRRASFGERSDPDEVWSDCYESERERWRVAARRALAAAAPVVTVEMITEAIAKVTDMWDEPRDEVYDIPPIARAVFAVIRGGTETSK